MGDEVMNMTISDYDGGDDERVSDWEAGLPSADDLAPLSQNLIPAELAAAFSITPEPRRSSADVIRASRKTLSTLRGSHSLNNQADYSAKNYKSFDEKNDRSGGGGDEAVVEVEEADSALRIENNCSSGSGGAAAKRARLVWTPQLHKRFVEVVAHLGIKNAVPKTIMQLMNVEGLTRENVASHLQKYRLYLKRMHGGSDEDGSSDPLFASTPVPPPQSLTHESASGRGGYGNGNGHMSISVPMHYPPPPGPGAFMAMPPSYMGMASGGGGGYHGGFEAQRLYSNMMQHQQSYGGMVSYPPHVAPNEK